MRIKHALIIAGFFFALNAGAVAPWAFDPFMGKWAGVLEYKDYQGSGIVKVPVTLEVKPSDRNTANWYFNYDDFGKTIISDEVHTWTAGSAGKGSYTVKTRGRPEVETYSSKDFEALFKAGIGKAILMGSATEVGRKVEVRRTIRLEKTKLITLKETRAPGEAFAFRNQSTYSRQ